MKTQLHVYSYDVRKPDEAEAYHQLASGLRNEKGRGDCFWVLALPKPGEKPITPGEITLETKYLFPNQWNSTTHRVFDWYEGKYVENNFLKFGYWLEITPEMVEIRRNTLKCGYTGMQFPAATGYVFNETDQALGSPYLKESDLHLLRLLPVCDTDNPRQPLSKAERDHLLPLYIAAQTKQRAKARTKEIASVKAECAATIQNARTKCDGFLWLLGHGVNTENCIFYDHTGRFAFGWRQSYPEAARPALVKALEGFPFPYDIK